MTDQVPPVNPTDNNEIDLIELIRHIWNGRWLIAKVTALSMVIGLIIAFTTQEQYRIPVRLLPEVKEGRGGASSLLRQFGGLGGLGSLSFTSPEGSDAIRADLYPEVLKSTPFFMALLQHELILNIAENGSNRISIENYLWSLENKGFWGKLRRYTIGLPATLKALILPQAQISSLPHSNTIPERMSLEQFELMELLRKRIHASIDPRSGIITLSVSFHDPYLGAQIAQFAIDYLIEYVVSYRVQKAQRDLGFIEDRYAERELVFISAQHALAAFRDKNRNVVYASVQAEEQRLQDQYNLAFNVYNGLAQQLEQARIKLQEETPVLQVLEPVYIPVRRFKPERAKILIWSIGIGLFLGCAWIYLQTWMGSVTQWRK